MISVPWRHVVHEYAQVAAAGAHAGRLTGRGRRQQGQLVGGPTLGFRKAECLDGNVGYIDFRGFWMPYLAAETARAAMAFVAHADALIVDLRQNRGGEPPMVAYLASFLFDERTHLNDIYVREGDRLEQYWTSHIAGPTFGGSKPLYVLTSRTTFSAAEDFAYALKNLKRATIVGETTGGGAHPTRRFAVTEHFALDVIKRFGYGAMPFAGPDVIRTPKDRGAALRLRTCQRTDVSAVTR